MKAKRIGGIIRTGARLGSGSMSKAIHSSNDSLARFRPTHSPLCAENYAADMQRTVEPRATLVIGRDYPYRRGANRIQDVGRPHSGKESYETRHRRR